MPKSGGFWTPDYLEKKLRRLSEAHISNLILCISESLNCAELSIPQNAHVICFTKRVNVELLLQLIET